MKTLDWRVAAERFIACPFCGEQPNVFQVPHPRFSFPGWVVECKTMGCLFERSASDQSLGNLAEDWNKRSRVG